MKDLTTIPLPPPLNSLHEQSAKKIPNGKPLLTVILPTYNESGNVGKIVAQIRKSIYGLDDKLEILFRVHGRKGHRKMGQELQSKISEVVKCLRSDLEMSQGKFANLLGVSVRTVTRWECDSVAPDTEQIKRLHRLKRAVDHRLKIDGNRENLVAWLTSPQRVQCCPIDLLSSVKFGHIFHIE